MSVDDDDFDFKLWLIDTTISDAGLKKLIIHAVIDRKSLYLMSREDISALKLATADNAKFLDGLQNLKPVPDSVRVSPVPEAANSDSTKQQVQSPTIDVSTASPAVPTVHVSGNINEGASTSQQSGTVKTQFSIEEVAGFLAGNSLPSNLNQHMNCQQLPVQPSSSVPLLPEPAYNFGLPGLFANQQPSTVPIYGAQPNQQNPFSVQQLPYQAQASNWGVNQTPSFSPYQIPTSNIPGRLATTHSLGRDPYLQAQVGGFHNSVLQDWSNLNSLKPQGENQLYLPVNFVSHMRGGARSEDEELLKTEAGTSLYLGNSPRKVQPEKLNQGLFLGANARILARIIPNLTPAVAVYLDYLRMIGDLLVNYTSQSVYVLDHLHRFEVVELNRPFNQIDPTLSLNNLKRKEVIGHVSTASTSSKSSTSHNSKSGSKSDSKQTYGELPMCWQWNQPDGCKFENCRYIHKCNVSGCGAAHPAWKHSFRANSTPSTKSV
jgi:hypothetical protein